MWSRSSADAPAMLFQLTGSPVQRRGPRYTSAPHEAAIITLPPCLSPPHYGATFFHSEALSMCWLCSCFTLNRQRLAITASETHQSKYLQGFMAFTTTLLLKSSWFFCIYISSELNWYESISTWISKIFKMVLEEIILYCSFFFFP